MYEVHGWGCQDYLIVIIHFPR